MPFVTEEIRSNITSLPLIISDYPQYEKKWVFKEDEAIGDEMIEFVRLFRNKKAEMNLGKEYKVYIKKENDYTLISQLLKWQDKILEEPIEHPYTLVETENYQIYLYNEHQETEKDREKKQKDIEALEKSIAKRKSLLNNQNFLAKAPATLVSEEQKKLAEEQRKLKNLKEE